MNAKHFRRNPGAVWRATDTFLVAALPPDEAISVVGSAALVWRRLAAPVTLDELAEQLAAETGALTAQVRLDVAVLIDQLLPLGLVEVVA